MKKFLLSVANFLAGNQAGKSIALEVERQRGSHTMMPKWGAEWADMRNAAGLFGYPSVEDTAAQLERMIEDHFRPERERLLTVLEQAERAMFMSFKTEDQRQVYAAVAAEVRNLKQILNGDSKSTST